MSKIYSLFILVLVLKYSDLQSQSQTYTFPTQYTEDTLKSLQKKPKIIGKTMFGLSIGHESFIGMPKLGALGEISLEKNIINPVYFYGGADISLFFLFSIGLSPTIFQGFRYKSFSIDHGVTYSTFAGDDLPLGRKYSFTYNPKIGVNYKNIWLRIGPSIRLGGRGSHLEDWMKFGNTYLNFDLLYTPSFKK